MGKSNAKEEVYEITPLGLISTVTEDIENAKSIADSIELYMRRHGVGMAINEENKLRFVQLEKID